LHRSSPSWNTTGGRFIYEHRDIFMIDADVSTATRLTDARMMTAIQVGVSHWVIRGYEFWGV